LALPASAAARERNVQFNPPRETSEGGAQNPLPAIRSEKAPRPDGARLTPGTTAPAETPVPVSTAAVQAPATDPVLVEAASTLDQGRWREARGTITRFLKRDKSHRKSAEAWTLLGRTYIDQGRPKKSLGRFEKALKQDPHYAPAYLWKGRAFEAMGKMDEAANEYQTALHADANLAAAKEALDRVQAQAAPAPQ
jgi:tetratricopeptide (TPR) repeat protein